MMAKLGIESQVRPNFSIDCEDDKCVVERGCDIVFVSNSHKCTMDLVWSHLKAEYNLGGAHYEVKRCRKGCILHD